MKWYEKLHKWITWKLFKLIFKWVAFLKTNLKIENALLSKNIYIVFVVIAEVRVMKFQ
jgi:hypothetical protein